MDIRATVAFILGSITPVVFGCSPEGWVTPTLESKTHYADIVAVGTVTEILGTDPASMLGETYGADVFIQCSYKPVQGESEMLPGTITIGGAGFIHGMCDSKDLVANEKYILFLEKKQKGNDFYMQSGAAVPYSNTKIDELVQMCNLEMNYPEENGFMMKRKICKEVPKVANCKQYQEPQGMADKGPVVKEAKMGDATTEDPNNSSSAVVVSIGLLMTSLFALFL